MHNEQQRNTSNSFGKIKEAIVLKIKKTFDNCMHTVESISSGEIKLFDKTT